MLPSYTIQLMNVVGNFTEICLIALIAFLTYQNNKAIVEKNTRVNLKLDRLIVLTAPLKRIEELDPQETKVIGR